MNARRGGVALKVLPAGALADEETRKRFRREAMALSKLNHPNIAAIHDFNTERDVDFLAMESIAGATLSEKSASGALPEADVVSPGRQASQALDAAHEQGIIYRDLKPGNIMVTTKGLLKVLDFGLAKLFQPAGAADKTLSLSGSQGLTGTLPDMAPERQDGREVDSRTDIHALGAILHELATGRKVFPQDTASEAIQAILHELPELPRSHGASISDGLERVIPKCLQKDPADRYASAKELIADLGGFLDLQSEIARDVTKQIGIRLREEKMFRSAKRKAVDPQALDAYLKGIYSGDGEFNCQAVKLDPDFALAYIKIAEGYFYSGLFGDIPPPEAFSKMKQAAFTALHKDDSLGEAHGYLAVACLHYDLDWAGAEKEFKRALELNPSLAMIHHLFAHLLMALGRTEGSMAEVKLAMGLDPFAWDHSLCSGWHCLFSSDQDDAIMIARASVAADPKDPGARVIMGWAFELKSMVKEAIDEFQAAAGDWKGRSLPLAGLGHACAISGKRKEAGDILGWLLEKSKGAYVPAYDIAVVYAGLGGNDRDFDWLAKALEGRSGFLVDISRDRRFDVLRSDPRLKALFNRIGRPLAAAKS